MPAEISPKKVQKAVQRGHKRMQNFRNARLMFLRNYVGQYYDKDHGEVGHEALNMIFNAVRNLIPNIVMANPRHRVHSQYLASREYAELLQLALQQQDKKNNICEVYRRVIVDAIFTLGILKTGLAESDSVYAFDDYNHIDTGEVFTEAVDFDNFIVDPNSRDHMFRDAAFLGDVICVPRENLMDSGLYDNELIEQLPSAGDRSNRHKRAAEMSMRNINIEENYELQDEVEIAELWVPSANALLTVPAAKDVLFDEYLRVDDYYGPDEGPYTLLALTPPVPSNPLPIPMVGIWNDLHTLSNRMAKKVIDQAERQKDVVTYRRASADDAQELLEAGDGDTVAVDDPDGVNVLSFGGQQRSNEAHLQQLQNWFNMMAANPEALGGQRTDAKSATEARILQNQASTGLEDTRNLVYQMASQEARKRAWFLHTDPFIQLPLIKRVEVREPPMQVGGMAIPGGSRMEDTQVMLTPEARSGDWLDFTFEIEPESMGMKNSEVRYAEALEFATQIMPAAFQAAQTAFALGIPFNVKEFIIRTAQDRGIDWMDQVFFDPEFQQRMLMQMAMGPQQQGSQGSPQMGNSGLGNKPGGGGNPLAAIMQNGQPGQVRAGQPSPDTQIRQDQQSVAAQAQSENQRY